MALYHKARDDRLLEPSAAGAEQRGGFAESLDQPRRCDEVAQA